MAYVYPEDSIENGVVIDPRPFNRTLGRYAAEMGGMLDRDNFFPTAITTAKLNSSSGSASATSSNFSGVFNKGWSWRSTATQTIVAGESVRRVEIVGIGDPITTNDSALVLEFSGYVNWVAPASFSTGQVFEMSVTVDGITVAKTARQGIAFENCPFYCVGYQPVGAGIHNVKAWATVYVAVDEPTLVPAGLAPADDDFYIESRELIVRERRR
ncbi:MAG: hypothetical protein ABIL09_13805 [Gemmatimonadota bacterium]